jgi:hypothetical protein
MRGTRARTGPGACKVPASAPTEAEVRSEPTWLSQRTTSGRHTPATPRSRFGRRKQARPGRRSARSVLVRRGSDQRRRPVCAVTAAGCTNRTIRRPAAIRASSATRLPQSRNSRTPRGSAPATDGRPRLETRDWRDSGLSRAPGACPAFRCARYRNHIDRKRPLSRHRLCVGEVAAKPASPTSRHRATTQRRPGSSGHSPRASSSRSASGCCAPSASATSEPSPRRSARAGSTKLASRTPRNATPSPQSPTSSAAEYAHFGCAHAVLRVRSQRRSGRYARSWSWRSSHQRAHWV